MRPDKRMIRYLNNFHYYFQKNDSYTKHFYRYISEFSRFCTTTPESVLKTVVLAPST
ncbi:MAG: hypothetical protein RIS29_2420 [Bacteroidota bacterium]|jgi:hypothetical protein